MFKKLFGVKKAEPQALQQPVKAVAVSDNSEIIAAISAAVYYFYEGTGVTPKIKNIRPAAPASRPVWAMAGLLDNTRPF